MRRNAGDTRDIPATPPPPPPVTNQRRFFLGGGREGGQRPVLRIHEIFVWIRIRGSLHVTNGSGSGSCYFHHSPSRRQQKTNFKKFFCKLLFEGTFFKDKKSKRFTNSRTQGFSYYFCLTIEGSGGSGFGSGSAKLATVRFNRSRIYECTISGFWALS